MTLQNTLVLGGARSGKSAFAEKLVAQAAPCRIYIATAQIHDDEMAERVRAHRARRDASWTTVDAPLELAEALAANDNEGSAILVDCLTLWTTNLMLGGHDCDEALARLAERLAQMRAPVVFVSNEVGLGIVPDNKMARDFRDLAGRVNQSVAAMVGTAYFVAAGLPLKLKG